jgi:putative iron-regulated protein
MIHDPEEEHDCFSDNTHASHFFDALGIRNVYLGTYRRADRSIVTGPSISDLVKAKSPEIDAEVRAKLDAPAIDALLDQTKSLERAVATLDLKAIKFEGSDSLDNPDKVQPESKAASDGGEGAN